MIANDLDVGAVVEPVPQPEQFWHAAIRVRHRCVTA